MPFTIPAGYAQTTIHITDPNLVSPEAITVNGWDLGGGTLADLIVAFGTSYIDNLLGNLHPACTVAKFSAYTQTEIIDSNPNLSGGAASGQEETVDNALLVRLTSGLRGRKNEGRNYWPGFLKTSVVAGDGTIDNSFLGTMTTNFGAFYTDMTTAGFPPVILHKDGSTPTPINNIQLSNRVAVQRRRLGR